HGECRMLLTAETNQMGLLFTFRGLRAKRKQEALRTAVSRAVLALLCCLPLACGKVADEENPPPGTVKIEGAAQVNLEEWTELVGTTTPLPDRVARISAPVEGRVVSVLGDPGKP